MFAWILFLCFIFSLLFLVFGPLDIKFPAAAVLALSIILIMIYNKFNNKETKEVSAQPLKMLQSDETQDISENHDITDEDIINENVIFEDNAIYFKKKRWDGVKWTIEKQRVYVYKRNYHLDMGTPPRFHICRCSTINSFLKQGRLTNEYRKSDDEIVWVRNIDSEYKETKITHLPLCLNCYKKMKDQYNWLDSKTDNRDFIEKVINKTRWA